MAKTTMTGANACNADVRPAPLAAAPAPNMTTKTANLASLGRIEAQVGRIRKMIEQDRCGTDVLRQLTAARNALRSVGRDILRDHLRGTATVAMRGGGERARKVCEELVELFRKSRR